MTPHSLKPFDAENYLSEQEALKQIEEIPIPKKTESGKKDKSPEAKTDTPHQNDTPNSNLENRTIDSDPADNSSTKNYTQWTDYFNNLGIKMTQLPDYYALAKTNNTTVIESVQKDLANGICAGPTIDYKKNSLEAKITHYKGSTTTKPIEHKLIILDYSDGKNIEEVMQTTEGYNFIKALLNTNDDATTIMQTLQKLSGKTKNKIKIWTPDQQSRKTNPSRVTFLSYDCDSFHVDFNYLYGHGRSRGVRS